MTTDKEKDILISNYLSGNASTEDKERLSAWISESNDNRAYYQQLKNIWEASHPAFNPNKIDTDKAYRKVISQTTSGKWYHQPSYWISIAAAALILPLIGLSAFLWTERAKVYEEIAYQEVFTPYGTHSKINLPDSSIVWINAGSSLKYPLTFIQGEREVQLAGEAYFEVESDIQNPFLVTVGKVKVRATGTAFNVEAYNNDSIVAVTMVKGNVDVTIGQSQLINLLPGERMEYNMNTSRCEIVKTNPYKWYAWKEGTMVFRDDPLEYVFKKIGQTFNLDIEVKDPVLAQYLYRATFEKESLDEILRLLKMTAPIRYENMERKETADGQFSKQQIKVYKSKK